MKRNYSNIKKAKYYLDNNECVAIPTETVYGLAGNAYSSNAVKKIFKLKKRPSFNPLIVHYSKVRDLQKDCEINQYFIKLYKKFCPGPLTFVLKLKKNSQISKYVTNKKKTLAVRFPKHSITRLLLNKMPKKTFIISEIGINHNGQVDLAKKLIKASKDAGADAVKFQKRDLNVCIPNNQKKIMRETPWGYISYLDYKKKRKALLIFSDFKDNPAAYFEGNINEINSSFIDTSYKSRYISSYTTTNTYY